MTPWGMPVNGSLHGVAADRLMAWSLGAIMALFVCAHVLLLRVLLRRNPAAIEGGRATSIWAVEALPLLAVTGLFVWMTITAERLWADQRFVGASPGALQVEVVGVQFQWYFRYPGPDAEFGRTRPELVSAATGNPLGLDAQDLSASDDIVSSVLMLPVGREVDLRLRAHDVIHGFFIPGMRVKQNAVPGLVLHVHFTPQAPGNYPILCTQVCGSGHSRMQAVLRVVPPDKFAAWLAARQR